MEVRCPLSPRPPTVSPSGSGPSAGRPATRSATPPGRRSTRWRRCTNWPSSAPTASRFHDDDLIPFGIDDADREHASSTGSRAALTETGLVVPMVTTNLFTHPVFKDGGFTSNDRAVRRFALRKVMRNIDLAAELGAQTYVIWGGREGAEYDGAKDVRAALDRYREAHRHAGRLRASTRATASGSRSSRSRTSRAATSCCRPSATRWPSSPASSTTTWSGVNPEVGHEQMAGLNFAARHRPGAVARQAVPHRPERPARHQVRPGPGVRPRRPAERVLPGRPAGVRRPGGGPAYDGPRHFDYKPSRTEDNDGRLGLGGGQHAHVPAAQGAGGGLPRRPRGAGGAGRVPGRRARAADARRRRDATPTCWPTAARSRTSTPTRPGRPATGSSGSTSWRSSTCSAPAEPALVARDRLVDPVVQGRRSATPTPGRWCARAGPRTRPAPRSTPPPGGQALQAALAEAGGLDDVAAISVAGQQHGMVCLDERGDVVRPALLWNDTRSAAAAADLVAELGGGRRGARRGRVGGGGRQRAGRLVHGDEAALAGRARAGRDGAHGRASACRTTGSPGSWPGGSGLDAPAHRPQ